MFTPLGIKTDYSLLKSLIKVEDLVLYAKNNNYKSIGILDDNLFSSHMFYNLCIKNNIKPIIGLDITIEDRRIFLYPKSMKGLTTLFKLTKSNLDNNIKLNDLNKYNEEVILVLPFESIDLYDNLSKLFTNTFLSFKNNREEIKVRKVTTNIVYINDIYSLKESSSKYVNYLYLIEHNKKLGDIEFIDYRNNSLKHEDYDTSKLTNLINIEFPTNKRYIPHFDDEIKDSKEYLKNLAEKGLNKRLNGEVTEEYSKRLNYELDVISNMGFTDYFLIVFDYVRFAVKNGIYVGVGRGSAAGSLVAYSLGITWIDPLKYNLLFERFLNPERITMPDIDIDFDALRKDEVVEYVKERYGESRVAKIITFGTMTAKEVLRIVAKINDVDDATLSSLSKYINSKLTLKENLTEEVKALLNRNSKLRKVYEEAYELEGLKKHIGTHAAGVVISSLELSEIIPTMKSGNDYLTGYTMNELEELGLIKMDFLSIKNLTIIANIIKRVEEETNKPININRIPLNDPKVYELFANADTVGIFQFESAGMKQFLKRLKPNCFEDLVMAIAIYRPGPMDQIDDYLDRKNNGAKIDYIDESLKPILESTYGILIYQEQIMEILRKMGGYSYAEADIIRRAISKKKMEVIENERARFIPNAIKNGYSEEVASKVYDLIVKFANFGFNKSHSVAYAMIAYQMAYLKVYYKEYYYINLLDYNIGGETKTKEYIFEAKKLGINILKPSVNLSDYSYNKESDGIRLPLRVIKGVGEASSNAIISKRGNEPFKDFFDFMARCYGFNVNKKTLEALIFAGTFDEFGVNRNTLYKNITSAIRYAELIHDLDESLVSKPLIEETTELPELELMKKELDLFGYYVSTHPANKYTNVMKQVNIKKYFDKRIETVVLIDKIKRHIAKNNKEMAFITASDETTSNDFILFSDYINYLNDIKEGDLVRIFGKVERNKDKYSIIINKMEKI